jgi:hypothetical protein
MNILSLFGQSSSAYDNSGYNTYNDMSNMDMSSTSNVDPAAAAAIGVGFLIFMFIFIVLAYVVTAIFLGMIFKKAGVPVWKAWVPIYNSWIMLELGDQPGFWAVLAIVPVVNIVSAVFMYMAMYKIGLKLGKEGAFVLLAIFLPIVWMIWLAVDKSTWKGAPLTGGTTQTPTTPQPPAQAA